MNNSQKGIATLKDVLIIVVAAVLIGGGVFAYKNWWMPKEANIACTLEAKVCPDGSSVSRTGPNCEFEECSSVDDETADWETFSSVVLGISFKYPKNYIIMDRLNNEEKSILLGDKEFSKPSEFVPWYNAPIQISQYEERKDNNSDLSSVKRSTMVIDGQTANVIEGRYQDYPAPGMPANNHIKIISIPNKNLTIMVRDRYGDKKSDWNSLSSVFDNILGTVKFK